MVYTLLLYSLDPYEQTDRQTDKQTDRETNQSYVGWVTRRNWFLQVNMVELKTHELCVKNQVEFMVQLE